MSQFTSAADERSASPWARRLAVTASALVILVLATLDPLQVSTELVVLGYGAVLVAIGVRRPGPGPNARVPYATVVPWLRLFFALCAWELFNWFNAPYGSWRTLSDLSSPALHTWLGRFLAASLWVWCGWWLLDAGTADEE